MRMPIVFCVLSLLIGCQASDPVKPQQVVEVKVPVPVACVDSVPEIPKTAMPDPKSADTAQLAAGAASDIYALAEYSARTHALLIQCSKPQEAP
jgi:hypothetical protein